MKYLRFTQVVATLPKFQIDYDISSQTSGMVNLASCSCQVSRDDFKKDDTGCFNNDWLELIIWNYPCGR